MKKIHYKLTGKIKKSTIKTLVQISYFLIGVGIGLVLLSISFLSIYLIYEKKYHQKTYPGVSIAQTDFSGATTDQIKQYWLNRNLPFQRLNFILQFENHLATISASQLDIGFDATLSAIQAYQIGRSGNFFTDLYLKYAAWKNGIDLKPLFTWKKDIFTQNLTTLADTINIEPENALFEFRNGRVTAFKLSKNGRYLNQERVVQKFTDQLELLASELSPPPQIIFSLPVDNKLPLITNEKANDYGIKELLGKGESYFKGSIAGRIHNLTLAASRLNGVLIPPETTFSFNDAVGDISAATGYKQAYVIKSGRTVLDDGGGVCQVSTTFFRAALNSGLPIIERHAHSYRVGYYEQGGWKPGFDATVYAPSYDLKVNNNTPVYILIQAYTVPISSTLVFEFYGQKDNRIVEISSVRLWDYQPSPPDLYQDDPTLPTGEIKQVDWANPGVKAAFDYKVTKNNEVIFEKNFFSNFIPWQAVFLRGTGPVQ